MRGSMFAGAIALGGALAACGGGGEAGGGSTSGGTLNLLSWPGHTDPKLVGPFEQQYGAEVKGKEYVGGDQMLAAANSAAPGTFDVVHLDIEYVVQLQANDQIAELNREDYPAFNDYFPEFQHFPGTEVDGKLYGVVMKFGFNGMAFREDVLTEQEIESRGAEVLWDKKVKGRVGWFDWYLPSMGAISAYLGNPEPYNIDNAALEELKTTLFSLKDQTAGFYALGDVFSTLANGQSAAIAGAGFWQAQNLKKQGHPVWAAIPREGGIQWTECLSIFKAAKNPELAQQFIQYATSPGGQMRAAILPSYQSSIPNQKGWELVNEREAEWAEFLRLQPDKHPNVMDDFRRPGRIHIRSLPVQQSIEEWNEIWTEFKSL